MPDLPPGVRDQDLDALYQKACDEYDLECNFYEPDENGDMQCERCGHYLKELIIE
jgi:uncharacterized paraquat-inducible protein A